MEAKQEKRREWDGEEKERRAAPCGGEVVLNCRCLALPQKVRMLAQPPAPRA